MKLYTVIYKAGNLKETIGNNISRALTTWIINEKKKTGNYNKGKFKIITNK
jgi:hypothetical protein